MWRCCPLFFFFFNLTILPHTWKCFAYPALFWILFQRVKVYRLSDDGKWDDRGTGHVTVDYLEVCKFSWSNLWSKVVCENNCQYTYWFSLWTNATPQRSEELGLFVVDEEDNETLLMHRISSDDIYRKQEGFFFSFRIRFLYLFIFHSLLLKVTFIPDTIISWRDPEYSTELALSFQEPTGCSYIW